MNLDRRAWMPRRGVLLAAGAGALLFACASGAPAASSPQPLGMLGRWVADPVRSDYGEAELVAKPASETLSVDRDDGQVLALTWSVIDAEGERHVERFEVPLSGRSARGLIDGRPMRVSVMRMSARSILITTSLDNGRWDYIVADLADDGVLSFRQTSFASGGGQIQKTIVFRRAG